MLKAELEHSSPKVATKKCLKRKEELEVQEIYHEIGHKLTISREGSKS